MHRLIDHAREAAARSDDFGQAGCHFAKALCRFFRRLAHFADLCAQLAHTFGVQLGRPCQLFFGQRAAGAQLLKGVVELFDFAAGAVVGVKANGDARTLQRRKLMADAAQLPLKVGKLFAVELCCPRQLLLRERAVFLQRAVGIGNGFDAPFDVFVVGEADRNFGTADGVEFVARLAYPLPQYANILRALVGGLGEVTQAARLLGAVEVVPFTPQLCGGIPQLIGVAACVFDALDEGIKVRQSLNTCGNQ